MTALKEKRGYLALIIVAVASWLTGNLTAVDEGGFMPIPPHSPDYFSKGYTKWAMNAEGLLNNQLVADKMIHYSDDRSTYLEQPTLVFNQEKQPPWIIKSETGLVSADGKNISLNGRVVISRVQTDNSRALQINTTNLKVKPEISYAETDEPAELVSFPNKTTGKGMTLVFKPPIHIELLAHVKGKYEKN
jgi:lipopolysaccharide export system protein LptC